jgi:3-methyladenine DNA glycosylase AlkC
VAEPLKNFFDDGVVRRLAQSLRAAGGDLNVPAFVRDGTRGLAALELTGRGWHLAETMQKHLPTFPAAARILIESLGQPLPVSGVQGMAPFFYLPHVLYVSKYGLDHFESALQAQYELTQRFTAEFSIRPFLVRYPEATYERLRAWAADPNAHVRRLVSEGTRPRLPWAPRLRAFQENPKPVLALLELLKDDPERYVQRSVANNLNDIAKDHPELTVATCRRWLKDAPAGRRWIVGHALRSLVKQGHPGALEALGVGKNPAVRVDALELSPRRVRLGGELRFELTLVSTARAPQDLLVDYAVHFVKANGSRRPKVFKLKKVSLGPAELVTLRGKVSFQNLTTRTHHPGEHLLELLVNGNSFPLGSFEVHRG